MNSALQSMISPNIVAVIGASEGLDKFGGRIVHYLKKHGFPGKILPINSKATELQGLPCYPSIKDVGCIPDVVVIVVPAKAMLEQIELCASVGIKSAVLITGMLDEVDAGGDSLQNKVVRTAAAAGMRLLGPNCLGIVNAIDNVALTSSLAMEVPTLRPGGVGIVSQSGALMGTMMARCSDYGVGFSRCISVGNQADLELCDFFEYLIADEKTQAICLYIEGIKDRGRFFELARRAFAAGKPVLAVKAGRSVAGAAIGQSHTGSLAGSYDAFEAYCAANGVVVAQDPYVMILAADMLVRLPNAAGKPAGIAAIGSSGGSTANFADQLVGRSLRLPNVSDVTKQKLEEWMPAEDAHIPVDTGAFRGGTSRQGIISVLETMLDDDDVSSVVYAMTTSPRMTDYAAIVPEISRRTKKPILFTLLAGSMAQPVRKVLHEANYPFVDNLADAFTILELLHEVGNQKLEGLRALTTRPPGVSALPDPRSGQLTESEAKALVAAYGISTAGEVRIANEAGLSGLKQLALPAVVKGVSRNILHKSEANIVRVGLESESEVRSACEDVFRILRDKDPEGAEGVTIQEMVIGEAELFMGARFDPEYGPLVTVGFGGIFVEILRDVAIAAAPIDTATAKKMIMSLKLWPLLNGARGRNVADADSAAQAVSRLSWLAADMGSKLIEIDVNPLIVKKQGEGAVAVDAAAVIA
ncbi:acetate--CoA ligase family protein [Bradyrhizobium sp. JYMT SZCCT0428]|uniref:acetate--CoA ligase family protein n=1 Tax=Bradyrhizobium sp. JYMT SZCCT0428 TaxID=2807673 RepID=UPI001BA89B8E|nr:acetate--CoA ligase family protein [Bradyrhizobium sp. JYMT SZCCT0428]MBR1149420.1 acetate--CoA ligase family protein [Bradyrhizobium sp. JYMT SZCCT0428]